jgi:hypothetical protein
VRVDEEDDAQREEHAARAQGEHALQRGEREEQAEALLREGGEGAEQGEEEGLRRAGGRAVGLAAGGEAAGARGCRARRPGSGAVVGGERGAGCGYFRD